MSTAHETIASLHGKFSSLCTDLQPGHDKTVADGWFQILLGLYRQPHRQYHTLDHVAGLLDRLDALKLEHQSHGVGPAVGLSIWFHDAVYTVGGPPGQNEKDSAALATAFLTCLSFNRYPSGRVFQAVVAAAIIATVHGPGYELQESEGTNAARLMCDLDLAGFADPPDRFEQNNVLIRKEFASVSDEAYRWGRLKFLSYLMAKPKIFYLLDSLESPARRNIERHMADLIADRL